MSIEVATLENGLRVVTDHMPELETVSAGIWVGVGTRHERREQNGVAHLLEHMVFKGTPRRSARQIAEEIEQVGGLLNAYTSRETTAYYAKVLKGDLALAVDILADILRHSVFDPVELDREREVIVQEIGQALDTPEDLVFDRFQERAYPDQGLGRPVLGRSEIVTTLSREAILEFMAERYGPRHMIAVAAGNVVPGDFVRLIESAFGDFDLDGSDGHEPATYTGGDVRDVREGEQVHVILGFDAVSLTDPDYYAAWVLSHLLGGGMSSRLFQEVREARGLAYSIYSFLSAYRDGGIMGIYAGTAPEKTNDLIAVACEVLRRGTEGLTDAELHRVRAQLKAGLLMGLESSFVRCEQLGGQMLTFGRVLPVDEIARGIDSVERNALDRVLARILDCQPTFAALGPLKDVESFDAIWERVR